MEGLEFVVNQLSPEITQGIAATLIIIRAGLCMQSGPIRSEPPPSVYPTVPMTSTPAEMPVSEVKSKPGSEDLSLASSSMESVTTVAV